MIGRLGLGTWEIGDQKTPIKDVSKIISLMLEAGGNIIDTADNYDGAESIIGHAIAEFDRDDMVIVTKCGDYTDSAFDNGMSTNSPEYKYANKNFTPAVIERNIKDSLKNLRVDYVDVLLIHTCSLDTLRQGDVIDALIRAKEKGQARYIGYSGDNEEIVFASQVPEFSVMEMSLNITDMRNARLPLASARKAGMGIIAKRPIANAFWRDDLYPVADNYARSYRERADAMRLRPTDMGFSKGDDGWLEMALSTSMSIDPDVMAIGTTSIDHMRKNAELINGLRGGEKDLVASAFYDAQSRTDDYGNGKIWMGLE